MKISFKLLSIPPYISTSWKEVVSLQVESRPYGHLLIIELSTGNKIEIPNLEPELVKKIFSMHEQFLEAIPQRYPVVQGFSLPLEGMFSMMQHNPEQSGYSPFPQVVLEKVVALTKNILPEDLNTLPSAEPHCNCPYCQVVRAIVNGNAPSAEEAKSEEPVSDEDLKFRTWDIQQQGKQLYSVTNPLDKKEHYSVFLGTPIGCTCGSRGCEHIQAVLHS